MTEENSELDPLTAMAGELETLKAEVASLKGKLESSNRTANDLINSNKLLMAEIVRRSAPTGPPPATAQPSVGDTVLDSFKKHIGINSNK